jgi:predicted 3-demethylubiquinone-9 3-methyltransferase (glyoxalase superfamily)
MQKITPCLWYDNQAEEAVKFYASVMKNVKTGKVARYDAESAKVSGRPEGSVLTVEFSIDGQEFLAMNGGPLFKFTPAVSFIINCKDQEETDFLWEKLSEGGAKSQCGWLTDKFGVSWQIVPVTLNKYIAGNDPEGSKRAMEAMLKMTRIVIADLEKAYKG